MRSDATEAALGLLGLTASIDLSTASTIPLKRKSYPLPPPLDDGDGSASSESINCICSFTYDDGFSIACDVCSRWVHAACFDIVQGSVPEEWRCWVCDPRAVDRERAVRVQKARQKQMQELEADKHRRRVSSPGVDRKARRVHSAIEGSSSNAKRKRRASMTAQQHQQHQNQHHQQQHQQQQQAVEDEHVDIDEPSTHSYVLIDKDVVGDQRTRDKLKRLARHWRGVTALDAPQDPQSPVVLPPSAFPSPSPTTIHPLPKSSFSHPTLSSNTNPSVRPPSYAVHTTQPIPSSGLITPYTSSIIPSQVYLSDPLNAYAHLGMPKPFVHLFGPPLDVALDSRITGNDARFVRNGCRPNAVLRPVLCKNPRKGESSDDTLVFGVFALRDLKAQEEVVLGWEWDDGSVIHHLPALIESPHLFAPHRFEQYRHQMTSMLHALSSTFTTCACGAKARDCALTRLAEFVDGQSPPTPSPSPPSSRQDERPRKETNDQDGRDGSGGGSERKKLSLGPLIGVERGFRTRERVPSSGGMNGVEMVPTAAGTAGTSVDGDQMQRGLASPGAGPSRLPDKDVPARRKASKKGKSRAVGDSHEGASHAGQGSASANTAHGQPSRRTVSDSSQMSSRRSRSPPIRIEDCTLPPKLRKTWIHRSSDALRDASRADARATQPHDMHHRRTTPEPDLMDIDPPVDNTPTMPPPPLPVCHSPVLSTAPPLSPPAPTSPSVSFANLSLVSPVVLPSSDSKSPPPPDQHIPLEHESSSSSVPPPAMASPDVTNYVQDASQTAEPPPPDDDVMQDSSVVSPPAQASANDARVEVAISVPESSPPPRPLVQSSDPDPQLNLQHAPDFNPPDVPVDEQRDLQQDEMGTAQPSSTMPLNSVENITMASTSQEAVGGSHAMNIAEPPPRPPPKVKLSLKDFALRKKKQREEEMVKALASPATTTCSLKEEPEPVAERDRGVTEEMDCPGPVPAGESEPPMVGSHASPVAHADQHLSAFVPADIVANVDPAVVTDADPDGHLGQHVASFVPADGATNVNPAVSEPEPTVTLQAKVEIVEEPLRETPPVVRDAIPKSPTLPPPPPIPPPVITATSTSSTREWETDRERERERDRHRFNSPDRPPLVHSRLALSRQISQEDGEILSPPPPKAPPLAPRSHTPPTHPRSFHSHPHSGSASPSISSWRSMSLQSSVNGSGSGSGSGSYGHHGRSSQNTPPVNGNGNGNGGGGGGGGVSGASTPTSARPLPSGPRALRTAHSHSNMSSSYATSSSGRPMGAPRGPSADRERMEWERERGWAGGRGRGRGSGSGWTR